MADYLLKPGTHGFATTPVDVVWESALSGLASGSALLSTTIFTQTTFASSPLLMAYFTNGTMAFTPVVGGCLAFWWVKALVDGTTFEDVSVIASINVPAFAGSPDFWIPFDAAAFASGKIRYVEKPFPAPFLDSKLLIQNFTGVPLGTTGTSKVSIGSMTMQI